jgi:uncharacterized protein involved in type VI secretion and phage assembly
VSSALYESIARIARHEAVGRAVAAVGRVTDVFPDADHAATVELRDSGLVLPRVPIAVGAMGYAAIPAVDDLVVVLFADGDHNAPVVVGRLYHPEQDPPEHGEGEIVLRLPSAAEEKKLNLVVSGDEPSVKLDLPGDVKIELAEEKVRIEVGDVALSVEGAGGGRTEVTAGGSKLTLKKDGDISIKSATKLKFEAPEIELSGSAKVTIKGGVVEVN